MIRATKVLRSGEWSHVAADTVLLDRDLRHRRRMVMSGDGGLEFLLDLPTATALKDGDGLLLEDGRIVAVKAAPEPLAEVTADSPVQLLRLAWHIGNRHLAAELLPDRIRIRRDHVIEDMLRRLDATVAHVDAAFDPEGGAYGHEHDPHHHHGGGDHHA